MKEITVYLTNPDHYIHREWLKHPPKRTNFIQRGISLSTISSLNINQVYHYSRDKLWSNLNNHIVLTKEKYNLLHSNGSLIRDARKPWLVDFESGCALNYFHTPNEREKQIVKNEILDSKCKKILPYSKAAKEGFENHFDIREEEKTEILYPSLSLENVKNPSKNPNKDRLTLCFIARNFDLKGGEELIEAFKDLKDQYSNLELHIVSQSGKKYSKIKGVTHHGELKREGVFEVMRKSDIFVYPTLRDTFGLVLLEAMAHKLPIVTLEDYATPEIVEDGVSGYVCEGYDTKWYNKNNYTKKEKFYSWEKQLEEIRNQEDSSKVVEQIKEKTRILIEDEEKREKMGQEGFKKIESGKFSTETRNKKLRRIYEDAVE